MIVMKRLIFGDETLLLNPSAITTITVVINTNKSLQVNFWRTGDIKPFTKCMFTPSNSEDGLRPDAKTTVELFLLKALNDPSGNEVNIAKPTQNGIWRVAHLL